jgi:hypothetical protein
MPTVGVVCRGSEAGPTPQAIVCCLDSGEVAVTSSASAEILLMVGLLWSGYGQNGKFGYDR